MPARTQGEPESYSGTCVGPARFAHIMRMISSGSEVCGRISVRCRRCRCSQARCTAREQVRHVIRSGQHREWPAPDARAMLRRLSSSRP